MSLISRFFGRKDEPDDNSAALIAASDVVHPLSLAVVFDGPLRVDIAVFESALRAYHPSMKQARVEMIPQLDVVGLAGWDDHVVRLMGIDAPYPSDALEACVAPAYYGAQVKEQVRANRSHVILFYVGRASNPFDQYVALAAVAGALAEQHGIAVLNEPAHTSLPAGVFNDKELLGKESLEILRDMPLTMFFCGFVKYEVEGTQGVWMRTYGADKFGLPDFAALAEGHHEGERYSGIFNNVMAYMLNSGVQLNAGETMQIGSETFMKLREPRDDEYFLQGPSRVLVIALISESEINR